MKELSVAVVLALAHLTSVAETPTTFQGAPPPPKPTESSPFTAEEQQTTFSLPPGFEIELVAADPDIAKIVTVAFDEAGRMWAITAVEYPVDENESPERARALFVGSGRDRVLVFDTPALPGPHKPRTFAEGLAIPLGVLPYRDGAFVGHGDKVLFLRDTDGDGKADKRETILSGFGIQDSHLFPHQFTRGPGDWFYLAQGAFNYSKVKTPEEKTVEFNQTKMARFRADGTGFEVVCWGPNNIWGFVISRQGDMFIQEANDLGYPVAPFFIGAAYPGIGMHKPKPYAPFQPPLAKFSMGGTGLSGLALSEDRDGFPPPYRDVMYVANPITRKIQAIKIHTDGTHHSLEKLQDFILSSDEWFRPVAIHFGPDSCLYIVDWYNKIISHNEVPRDHPDRDKTRGRIWRVRHKSMQPRAVPDLPKVPEAELVKHLDAANTWQARAARHQIIDRKATDLAMALRRILHDKNSPLDLLLNAFWALEGLGTVEDDDLSYLAVHEHFAVRREVARLLPVNSVHLFTFIDFAHDTHPQVRAEVIRTLSRAQARSAMFGFAKVSSADVLLQMANPALDGPTIKTEQGNETVKTGAAADRDFERYLVRAALENVPEHLEKLLQSEMFPLENRLFACLALPPKRAAIHIARLWPEARRPLNEEELAIVAHQPTVREAHQVLELAFKDASAQKNYLTALLKIRDRLDPAGLAPLITTTMKAVFAREPDSYDLLLRVGSAFRLQAFEPEILAYAGRTNLTADQKLSAIRALRELGASQPHLFQEWVLASKPGEAVQRESLLALAGCNAEVAVPRTLELWPVLSKPLRKAAADKLVSSKPAAQLWLQSIQRGELAKEEVDEQLLEKLSAVLGDDPALAQLRSELKLNLQPVLRLNGENHDYVDYRVDLTGPFTVETWIKLDPGISNRDGILAGPGTADFNFHDARFRVWDAEHHDVIIAKKPIAADTWTHVAVTRDEKGRFKTYLNGELDNDQCIPSARPYKGLYVCRTATPPPGGPRGMVTEYRIWNCARTDAEIRTHYKASFADGSRPTNLVHYFSGDRWTPLHGTAQVAMTGDYPPLIDQVTILEQQKKLETYRLLADSSGDVAEGKALFKNICASCHNVQGEGGQIGPTLNGAGAMDSDALLRSMLLPNDAVESGYYVFRVETKDDEVLDGFLVRQTDQSIVLRQPNSEDRTIPRVHVKRAAFTRMSMMPEGLIEGLKREEVSHLFAYLKTLK